MKVFKRLYNSLFDVDDDKSLYIVEVTKHHEAYPLSLTNKRIIEQSFKEYFIDWLKDNLMFTNIKKNNDKIIQAFEGMGSKFYNKVPQNIQLMFSKKCVAKQVDDGILIDWKLDNGVTGIQIKISI